MSSPTPPTIRLQIEFSGGLELLFSHTRKHTVNLPSTVPNSTRPADASYLILYLRDNLLKERPELFEEKGTVKPGILVLINDTDWELEGEGEYELKDGDEIVFISTLHGG
ncbi:ubiquitin-related modifier 1 [Pterulicium gracile]|uniref:Ubiquitin-related modifier 1 n=1 Tax=Pterulicium gracile TaxID=1884261 RepID=A0A5C3QRA9_9AGAR|nr:ubiquitin-related modifier 1 [Pterula gracilis]